MRERGGRFLRVAVVWTLLTFVIAVLVAAQAMSSLYDGQFRSASAQSTAHTYADYSCH